MPAAKLHDQDTPKRRSRPRVPRETEALATLRILIKWAEIQSKVSKGWCEGGLTCWDRHHHWCCIMSKGAHTRIGVTRKGVNRANSYVLASIIVTMTLTFITHTSRVLHVRNKSLEFIDMYAVRPNLVFMGKHVRFSTDNLPRHKTNLINVTFSLTWKRGSQRHRRRYQIHVKSALRSLNIYY